MATTPLKLRASAAESFRAPNLVQTNITPLRRQIGADDPYRFEVTALPSDGTAQRTVFRQGNQNLQPEEAKTWVAGFVLEVPKVRGLSVSFDYFKLNQNSVIENVGAAAAIDRRDRLVEGLRPFAAVGELRDRDHAPQVRPVGRDHADERGPEHQQHDRGKAASRRGDHPRWSARTRERSRRRPGVRIRVLGRLRVRVRIHLA